VQPLTTAPVVLFDGVCNLCTSSVQFLIARDTHARLRFASLQSDIARQLLAQHQLPARYLASVVLVDDGVVYIESDAALRVAAYLPWPWSLARHARVLPRSLRDFVYRLIANNRYRVFGRSQTCLVPTPEIRARFLDV
jgi:predicted DCC family thiol-disulfide oxidoreductase YuxK